MSSTNQLLAQISDKIDFQTVLIAKLAMAIGQLLTVEQKIMAALDDLTAQVAQNTSVEASAVQLIQGLATQLQAAIAAGNPAALQALAQQLNTSATALAAAITANTPPAPPPAPPGP
jgi:hypothetical protein